MTVRGGAGTTILAPSGPGTGTTWTLLEKKDNGTTIAQAVYYKFAGASEPTSYTWTFNAAQNASGGIIAYTGVNTTTPIDTFGSAIGSGNSVTAPSILTTTNDDMLVGFFGIAHFTTFTPPAGMTERYDDRSQGIMQPDRTTSEGADVIQAAAGLTGTKTATAGQSAPWVAHLVALKPAAAAPRSTSTVVDCPASTPANSPAICTVTVTDTDTGTKSPPQGTVDLEVTAQPAGSSPTLAPDPCPLTTASTSSSTCTFTFTSTIAGSYTITATYEPTSVHASSSGSDTITVTAGPPAVVTVTPPTATNQVDTEHCVTATVTDAFGNPNNGVRVFFTVTGVNSASGTGTTGADGTTPPFCYTGRLFGVDTIKAVADADGDGEPEIGEPTGAAEKTWTLPPSTAFCEVNITLGGRITADNGDPATFGGNAKVPGEGEDPQGQQEYQDHGPAQPMNVHSINVLALVCSDDLQFADIFGEATIDGSGSFAYRIHVTDQGEPGSEDTYWIVLENGYNSGDHKLEGGNVQIHKQ